MVGVLRQPALVSVLPATRSHAASGFSVWVSDMKHKRRHSGSGFRVGVAARVPACKKEPCRFRVHDLGVRVQGIGFGEGRDKSPVLNEMEMTEEAMAVQGSGFGVQGSGFRV